MQPVKGDEFKVRKAAVADGGEDLLAGQTRPGVVIPGPRSGTRNPASWLKRHWIPAFAGMTATGTEKSVTQKT